MKHLLRRACLLAVLLCLVPRALAYEFQADGFYFNVISAAQRQVELTYGENAYKGDVVVPATVNYNGLTFSVTGVGAQAFSQTTEGSLAFGRSEITSVSLPEGITYIGYNAFWAAHKMTRVTLPQSLESIDKEGFHSCTALTSVTLPERLTEIGSRAFWNCQALESLTMHGKNKTFGYEAFRETSVKTVTIDDFADWCTYSFEDRLSNPISQGAELLVDGRLVEYVTLPAEFERQPKYMLAGYKGLRSITIPADIDWKLDSTAIAGCVNLQEVRFEGALDDWYERGFMIASPHALYVGGELIEDLVLPVRQGFKVADYAFAYCTSLKSVTFPDGFTTTNSSYGTFANCTNLKRVDFGDDVLSWGTFYISVTWLGMSYNKYFGLFNNCTALEQITFGRSIDYVYLEENFSNCPSVKKLICRNSLPLALYASPETDKIDRFACKVIVPRGMAESYRQSKQWDTFYFFEEDANLSLRDGMKFVDGYLTFKVLSEEARTAEVCKSPGSVFRLQMGDVDELRLDVPAEIHGYKVIGIGAGATLPDIKKLSIILPDGITYLGTGSLVGLNIDSIALPRQLKYIGERALANCTNLHRLIIPAGVDSIMMSAFDECNLDSLVLQGYPQYIDSRFLGSPSSESNANTQIHLHDMAQWLGVDFGLNRSNFYLFAQEGECDRRLYLNGELVTDVVVPPHVKQVGPGAFANYRHLRSVDLGQVERVEPYAFMKCDNLTSIVFPPTTKNIGMRAFDYCKKLSKVEWDGCEIDSIGLDAFRQCALDSVRLENVRVVDEYAFNMNQNLKRIYIGEQVENLSNCAFYNCQRLLSVWFDKVPPQMGNNVFGLSSDLSGSWPDVYVLEAKRPENWHPWSWMGSRTYDEYTSLFVPYGAMEEYAWSWCSSGMIFEMDPPTGVTSIPATTMRPRIFSGDGRPLPATQPGLNILVYPDGRTEKVWVR